MSLSPPPSDVLLSEDIDVPLESPQRKMSVGAPLRDSAVKKSRLAEFVVCYMKNSKESKFDGSINGAFDTRGKDFDSKTKHWVPVQAKRADLSTIYRNAEAEKKSFVKAIDDYNATAKEKYQIKLAEGKTNTLASVWETMDSESEVFKDKNTDGIWGKVCICFRKLGRNEAAFKPWIAFLPSDSEYFSVISGGLKVILGAAQRTQILREEIADALLRIPNVLEQAQRVLAAYDWSDQLQTCSANLLASVLATLGQILSYYKQKTAKKIVASVFKQATYKDELSLSIVAMDTCCQELENEARTCDREMSRNTNDLSRSTNDISRSTNDGVASANMRMVGLEDQVQGLKQGIQGLQVTLDAACQLLVAQAGSEMVPNWVSNRSHSPAPSYYSLSPPDSPEARTGWEKFPGTPPRSPSRNESSTPSKGQRRQGRPLRKAVSYSTLDLKKSLSHLSYETHFDAPQRDLKANLNIALKLSPANQDRAVFLLKSLRLQRWLKAVDSSPLLINGSMSTTRSRTPVSFVCAKILDSLLKAGKDADTGVISLHFFCAEHRDDSIDPDASPAALMNSLLVQLMQAYKLFDLSEVNYLKNLDVESVKDLCAVFQTLVSQLPSNMLVFCVIENLAVYEDESRLKAARKLMKSLIGMIRKSAKVEACKVKLLLTVPNYGLESAEDLLEEKEMLTLPDEIEDGGGFTAMKWNLKIGKTVKDPNLQLIK
ncbi:hypothetical protein VTL71DRAFT_11738 [Oculimacula yallundae]|uniref:DUF7708 domain-containing protein n=1 Tax=Oculimacula yallundae TaxID=86028 RepID=A0ABR4CR35_9HELO